MAQKKCSLFLCVKGTPSHPNTLKLCIFIIFLCSFKQKQNARYNILHATSKSFVVRARKFSHIADACYLKGYTWTYRICKFILYFLHLGNSNKNLLIHQAVPRDLEIMVVCCCHIKPDRFHFLLYLHWASLFTQKHATCLKGKMSLYFRNVQPQLFCSWSWNIIDLKILYWADVEWTIQGWYLSQKWYLQSYRTHVFPLWRLKRAIRTLHVWEYVCAHVHFAINRFPFSLPHKSFCFQIPFWVTWTGSFRTGL